MHMFIFNTSQQSTDLFIIYTIFQNGVELEFDSVGMVGLKVCKQ